MCDLKLFLPVFFISDVRVPSDLTDFILLRVTKYSKLAIPNDRVAVDATST